MTSPSEIPTNDAVRWSGTRFGLLPTLSDEAERAALAGDKAVPALLRALADPERFVTAHVLLTHLSNLTYDTVPAWNGLEVSLRADGRTEIDAGQRAGLEQRWLRWYREQPESVAGQPEY